MRPGGRGNCSHALFWRIQLRATDAHGIGGDDAVQLFGDEVPELGESAALSLRLLPPQSSTVVGSIFTQGLA